MPYADIGGVAINYQILGSRGPSMALSPGGRHPYQHVMPAAERMAATGYRVLLHDRRNCGASDASFDPSRSEYEVWADDLDALLKQFGMAPAIIGGSSSGARLALTFALRHPPSVRALCLWRVTGGGFAVNRLAEQYYDQYIRLAGEGGMAAVCAAEHFAELIRKRPSNRERLMAYDPKEFIKVLQAWRAPFVAGANLPLIGTTEADLRSIPVPTCIIPGNDRTTVRPARRPRATCRTARWLASVLWIRTSTSCRPRNGTRRLTISRGSSAIFWNAGFREACR